jgi:hypothetical protein
MKSGMDSWGRTGGGGRGGGMVDRDVWTASVRLALIVSTVAAFAVMVLGAAGEVTEPAVVLVVILVGFAASWAQCGRVARPAEGHRVTLVSMRRRVG